MADSVLNIIVTAVDNFTARFDKMATRAVKIGKKFEKVGKKVTKAVTLPILAIGAASVKASADFERGMTNVATLVDTNVESMEAMGDAVLDISEDVPVAIEDLTSALFDLRSAGTEAEDAMLALTNAGKLSTAALGTTKQAADVGTSAVNAFNLEGAEAEAVYGKFFVATKFGKTTLADMSQGFGSVAKVVAANNIELDEFLAVTAAMTTTGLKASKTYTQQQAVLAGLTRQTKGTQKVFKELGVKDFPELVKQSGGYQKALERVAAGLGVVGSDSKQVRKALKGLDVKSFAELEKRAGSTAAAYEVLSKELGGNNKALLKALGSTEALNAVLIITGAQGDKAREALAGMGDSSSALDEAFQKQSQTQAAQWQKTKNIMQAAGIQIGKVLAPLMSKLAKTLQGAAKWFSGLDDDTKEWIITIAGIAATVGPVLLIFGKFAQSLTSISRAVGVVGDGIEGMGKLIKKNPLLAAAVAIAALAILIIENWEPIKEFFADLWSDVVSIFEDARDAIMPVINDINDVTQSVNEFVKEQTGVDFLASTITSFGGLSAAEGAIQQAETEQFVSRSLKEPLSQQASDFLSSVVKVEFVNTPAGTRIRSDDDNVDLSVGLQLEGQ